MHLISRVALFRNVSVFASYGLMKLPVQYTSGLLVAIQQFHYQPLFWWWLWWPVVVVMVGWLF